MKYKKLILVILLIIILFTISGCESIASSQYIYLTESFSINPYIVLYDDLKESDYKLIESKCNDLLNELDNKYNVNKQDSLITKINDEAYDHEVIIDEEFDSLINLAISCNKEISNKFDISIYPLTELWDFKNKYYLRSENKFEEIPSDESIKNTLEKVGIESIVLSKNKNDEGQTINTVKFTKEGTKIDLGSLVKGLAADYIVKILKDCGANFGIVNVGGNVCVFGNRKYNVGITTPFHEELSDNNSIIGYITTDEKDYSLVTSGTYERYIKTSDGKMYHHILDPFTGYPVESDMMSITIITSYSDDMSLLADELSTSLFTLGIDKALEYINSVTGLEAIIISTDKKIILSNGVINGTLSFTFNEDLSSVGYSIGR